MPRRLRDVAWTVAIAAISLVAVFALATFLEADHVVAAAACVIVWVGLTLLYVVILRDEYLHSRAQGGSVGRSLVRAVRSLGSWV